MGQAGPHLETLPVVSGAAAGGCQAILLYHEVAAGTVLAHLLFNLYLSRLVFLAVGHEHVVLVEGLVTDPAGQMVGSPAGLDDTSYSCTEFSAVDALQFTTATNFFDEN